MKKIILAMACGLFLMANSAQAAQKAKKASKGTITLECSQGFQGPEWEKHDFAIDSKGFISIFNGKDLEGWRSYGKTYVSPRWTVEDGCIHFLGSKNPNAKNKEGGDLIFAHKFKNFEYEVEWKISQGGNSGIFYLAQETTDKDGNLQPIYVSCPEYQVLDNANHPDAKLGKDGNRQSASLYDMIPAKPQNQKPFGQWNKARVRVENGKVTHFQNGKVVLQYELWTPEWIALLQSGKFSEKAWPAAFKLLSNCGGENHEGLFGFQDHGDDVWYRNIRVKVLE